MEGALRKIESQAPACRSPSGPSSAWKAIEGEAPRIQRSRESTLSTAPAECSDVYFAVRFLQLRDDVQRPKEKIDLRAATLERLREG